MKLKKKIPVFDIKLTKEEKKNINLCLKNNDIGGSGKFVIEFEKKFSKYVGCKYGIATTSGTTALHLACASLDLKKDDEVLVSSSTNMASAFSIDYTGATPVPIDVDLDTWQLRPELIEKKITKKTKAIMIVHLFGSVADMDKIVRIAKKYNLKIIEDCAEAHGVEYKKKKVGSLGDVAAFSFFVNKTMTSGEGGMLVTNSKKIADKAKNLKNLGYGKLNKFFHKNIGFNYRMSNLNAALGVAQLKNINKIITQKKRIYERYKKNLNNLNGINIPTIKPWITKYIMWVFNIYLDKSFPVSRDRLVGLLKNKGIETRNSFVPVNQQKVLIDKYKSFRKTECPNANFVMENGLYLPSGNNITNQEIDYICKEIKKISEKYEQR